MESQLTDFTLMEDSPLGTTVGGWIDSFSETVSHWGSFLSSSKTVAPAPQVELQTFHGTIHELPEVEQPLLGGHEQKYPEAEWGDESDLPGGDLDYDQIMELEAPPPPFGSEAYIQGLKRAEMQQRYEMGVEMGEIQSVEIGGDVVESAELAADLLEVGNRRRSG